MVIATPAVNPAEHLGLARWMAARYLRHRGSRIGKIEDTEEYSDACLGLVIAAERFKPELGFKFSTYAQWWVRQAIQRGLDERRGGENARNCGKQRAREVLFSEFAKDWEGDDAFALETVLADEADVHEMPGESTWDRLWRVLEPLRDKYRRVLFKRLCGMRLKEIGKEEEPPISRERVRQIEAAAIEIVKRSVQ